MARIFVVGSGVVGTATGRGFVQLGHEVTFVDVLSSRLGCLREEGFDAQAQLNLRDEPASFIFLTLPTPNAGQGYDLSIFEQGVRDVGSAMASAGSIHTVVVRSTVPPLTTEHLVKPLLEEFSHKSEGFDFCLASNPEFLRAESAADDFRWPWMTVIGARSKRVGERIRELLAPFGGEVRLLDNPATAEMIKCAHNIYNASKISFWNEMWLVCQALDINHDAVAGAVARSAEGSFNPEYGIRGGAPYGGVCLPKDTNGFLGFARSLNVSMPLLEAVVRVNDTMIIAMNKELERLNDGALNGHVPTPRTERNKDAMRPTRRRTPKSTLPSSITTTVSTSTTPAAIDLRESTVST